jgi:hypothetical protein
MERPPKLPLRREYHDAQVESVELGPRQEIQLVVHLDPVWNDGDTGPCRLHFSNISNWDDVVARLQSALSALPSGAYVDEIIGIVRPEKGVVGIDFARRGYVELRGARVQEI